MPTHLFNSCFGHLALATQEQLRQQINRISSIVGLPQESKETMNMTVKDCGACNQKIFTPIRTDIFGRPL